MASDGDFVEKLGSYQYVEDIMTIPSLKKKGCPKKQSRGKQCTTVGASKVLEDKGFAYTRFNNIFADLKKLHHIIILFYKLPQEGEYIFACNCSHINMNALDICVFIMLLYSAWEENLFHIKA